MYQIGNFLIFLAASPMVAAFWVQGAIFLGSLPKPQMLVWFFVGMVGMLLTCVLLHGIELDFTETATHEMAHALASEQFMGEPTYIKTNVPGAPPGETKPASSGWGTFWVAIAPYSFPLLAIPPLVLRLLPFG